METVQSLQAKILDIKNKVKEKKNASVGSNAETRPLRKKLKRLQRRRHRFSVAETRMAGESKKKVQEEQKTQAKEESLEPPKEQSEEQKKQAAEKKSNE